MPKTDNSQQQAQRTSVQDFLTEVDSQKKQKWRAKLDKHRSQNDWTRDTYQDDFRELKSDIDTVEELITDIQSEIKRIQGKDWSIGERPKAKRKAIKEYGGEEAWKSLKRKGNFDQTPSILEIHEPDRMLRDLKTRENQWISYQMELWKVAATKLAKVSDDFEQEYVDGKVAKRQMEYVQELQEMHEEKVLSKVENQINEYSDDLSQIKTQQTQVETKVEELEEQRQHLVEIVERAHRREEVMQEIIDEMRTHDEELVESVLRRFDFEPGKKFEDMPGGKEEEEEVEEPQQQTIDQNQSSQSSQQPTNPEDILVTDDEDDEDSSPTSGEFVTDESEPESQDEDAEEEQGDEYVAKVEGKTVEEQFKALDKLRDHYDLNEMSQRDIVEYMDIPRGTLMNIVLKDIYEELGETFPEITGKYGDDEEEDES